jgi:hypothetical protein
MGVIERTKVLTWGRDEIFTRIVVRRGQVTDFAIVYFTLIGGRPRQVVRYDCKHGFAHKDSLYERSPRKEAMPRMPLKRLFNLALDDVEENWKEYKRKYVKANGDENETPKN